MTPLRQPPLFQTQSWLAAQFEQRGIRPRRRFGQHYLIDRNLMHKLVDAAEIGPRDCVLEVGAGTGCLTAMLAARAGRVVACEIDDGSAAIAVEYLSGISNLVWIQGDALDRKSAVAAGVEQAVREAAGATDGDVMLVANLPYDIATPLILNLLVGSQPVARMCFTVQAEVAARMLARPATADYGPASVVVQALCEGRRVAKVPPQAFWPRPKVHSVMLRLDRRGSPAVAADLAADFGSFVRAFFLHRRQTMGHNARRMERPEWLLSAMERLRIDSSGRPETLTVDEWAALFIATR